MSNIGKFSRHAKALVGAALISGCSPMFVTSDPLTEQETERLLQILEDEQMARPVVQEMIRSSEGIRDPWGGTASAEDIAKDLNEIALRTRRTFEEDKIRTYDPDEMNGLSKSHFEDANAVHVFDGYIYLKRDNDSSWTPGTVMHEVSHSADGHSDEVKEYVHEKGTNINVDLAKMTLQENDFSYQVSIFYDLAEYPLNYRMKMLDSCLDPENVTVSEYSASCDVAGGGINPIQFYENLNSQTQEEWAEDQAFLAERDYGEVFDIFGIDEAELVKAYNNELLFNYFQEYLSEWQKEMKEIHGEDFFEREDYGEGLEHDEIVNKRWDSAEEMSEIDYQRPGSEAEQSAENELKIEDEPSRWGRRG